MPFGRFYLNSLIVDRQRHRSAAADFVAGGVRVRAAALSGRDALFLLYLATLMIPFQVTMIPNFILVR